MNAPVALTEARGRAPTLRFALRDLRGGLAGLRIFLLCIALGVAAIVGVESLARALNDGMGREGRVILGGDASFALIHRRLSADEQRFLEAHGSLSTVATVRGMARAASGDAALIEIKAVEPSGRVSAKPSSRRPCRSMMRSANATECSAPRWKRRCWLG